ncbi:MAG: vanadium-dependent haloperoxidase [Gemmatimonadaceae bacterium]|nr:vanadium-dependent haloperoxidase [Chitinophagaceae bacterium]
MKTVLAIILSLICWRASAQSYHDPVSETTFSVTEVMFHDVINPPAAARFYAYALLSGYETFYGYSKKNEGKKIAIFPIAMLPAEEVNAEFASLYAMLETGRQMVPSGFLLEEKQQLLQKRYEQAGVKKTTIEGSIRYATLISDAVVKFSKQDGYFKLSTRQRYKPFPGRSYWLPTAPEYMAAVEPHWNTIRPFLIDSAGQFPPVAATVFDSSASSAFISLATEVYTATKNLTKEQELIANFWDCNPFAVQYRGHMSIGLKKISPGGHWMGITGIAVTKEKAGFEKSIFVHTLMALTLHDAFLSCWQAKYLTHRMRPETAINRWIDPKWKPLLQTPPFPEYTSGHSVVSSAAAEILTSLFGDDFAFSDSTETYIGLPARNFPSFRAAAEEACISRLYGGIHFRDGIEHGAVQGRAIAAYIRAKLGLLTPFP